MKKDKIEKSLIKVNKRSIFVKIKALFNRIFGQDKYRPNNIKQNNENIEKDVNNEQFRQYIKNIENEETKLIKLQQMYRKGEIKEEQLTKTQIDSLCDLYDKQIEKLQKSNELRKKRIIKYEKKYNF